MIDIDKVSIEIQQDILDSTENLTLSHVNHLKLALNKEKDKVLQQRNITDDLKKEIVRYDTLLSEEKLISQLSLLSCTIGGGKDPFTVVNAVKELLFPTGDNFALWCCIRTGDTWTVVRTNNNASNENEFLGKISINTFDGVTRTLQIGSLHFLSSVLSIDEINKIYIEGSSNNKLNNCFHDACITRINPRCVWLFWGDNQLLDFSNVLTNYFAVIDTASQLTMSGLIHYIEHQELVSESLAGKAVMKITNLLYKDVTSSTL